MKALANFHPIVLLLYFLSVILTAMFATNPVLQLCSLVGGILFCLLLDRPKEILSNIGFYVPLFLMITVTNPLFSHNGETPLFFLNGNPVTLEAIVYGAAIAVMVVGVMFWCKCYSRIMTSDKFLYLFGKAIPKLSLILSIVLRFIPLFKRQMHQVSRAQKAMGLYCSKSYVDKIRSALRIFSVMVTWSLENAMETANSMKARGYGLKGRTNYSLFRFTGHDAVFGGLVVLFNGITIAASALGATDFHYYPYISNLSRTPLSILAYVSFGMLALFPFVMEIKENLQWKFYVSKI